jgi:hypothetical protein
VIWSNLYPSFRLESLIRSGLFELPLINTIILLASGFTVTYGHHFLINGKRGKTLYGLLYTIILAVIFTGLQGVEYSVSSFTISDGAFGSCFYFGTGLILAPIKNFNEENAKNVANKLSPFWVTGFSDAESSFSVKVGKDVTRKHNIRIVPVFIIELHNRDIALLNMIRDFFGLGTIITRVRRGKPTAIYSVQSLKSLSEVIIPHFKQYPLLTQKKADFILFSAIVNLMITKKHLHYEYLVEIMSIKASMNTGLSNSLKMAFPEIKKVERPIICSQVIKSPLWLVGFIEGEGCFYIKTMKKNNVVVQVLLTFSISQHSRDLDLMNTIKDYLHCGIVEKVNTRPNLINFVVYRYLDISEKIIPLFKVNPISGIKSLDFNDFCKVANLIENKSHLTQKGIHEISSVKKGMNSGRIL